MALFDVELIQHYENEEPEWTPPTFKDCAAADIDLTFFNNNEHAALHHIDDKKDVLVIFEESDLRQHNAHWEGGAKQNFDTGLYQAHAILYIRVSDYGPKPKVGKLLVMQRGRWCIPYHDEEDTAMSRITYDAGNLTITLEGLEDVTNALGDLKSKTPAAAKVAINATAREARKLMIARAKARYAVNAAGERHLKDLVQRRKATNGSLTAELHIAKMRNDLGYFQHSPTRTFTGREVKFAPEFVRGHVLKSTAMEPLTGSGNLSKGFLVHFASGHTGMVQRVEGSESDHKTTARGFRRWTNSQGQVEKLQTMGSPSATAMHNTIWPEVEEDVEQFLSDRLQTQVEKVIERAARKRGGA